jgi:hypothetical protein
VVCDLGAYASRKSLIGGVAKFPELSRGKQGNNRRHLFDLNSRRGSFRRISWATFSANAVRSVRFLKCPNHALHYFKRVGAIDVGKPSPVTERSRLETRQMARSLISVAPKLS